MYRSLFILVLLLFSFSISQAQIRLNKLVLQPKERYKILGADILVVDTLVMSDSSSIILNPLKKDNFIHAKYLSVGKGCSIVGNGTHGVKGRAGEPGLTQSAPCRNGTSGKDGLPGDSGRDALNVSLYTSILKIHGSLTISLTGGDGGDGGRGGKGGDGGSGTRVCPAGDGGNGGDGARGGDGGHGGSASINCKQCADLHLLMGEKIVIKNYGGFGGQGGDGGFGGQAGLGPVKDGRNGQRGKEGEHANQGKTGLVNLSQE
ncbi:MAG: hypothetical protein JSS79_09745 [Bacteroidetes bacterium]|nr:hypothetical protein [Bacteroidota bacterium]